MNIKIIGCIFSVSFQKTKYILNNLVKHRPDLINKHIIKGVMDIEWTRCLWKLNQNLGGNKRQDTVAVFVNKKYLGTHIEFQAYLCTKYKFTINVWPLNYEEVIRTNIENYYNNDKFTFVRMVFEVHNWEIGHIVFALFDKIVPETCEYFKQLCQDKTEGYLNSYIHRIDVNHGFIQAGRISNKIPFIKKENYTVNHDRRGVLSLASRRQFFNGPEFIISLQPNPWMNNSYVAFGRAVEGEWTLRTLEKLHSSDLQRIRIARCDRLRQCIPAAGPDAFFDSVVRGRVLEAVYARLYGKPEPLHAPAGPGLPYVKSIVQETATTDATVHGAIAAAGRPSWARRDSSTTRSGSGLSCETVPSPCSPSVRSGSDATGMDGCAAAGVRGRAAAVTSPTLGTEYDRKTETPAAGRHYGVRLPANHKDYWKNVKIYGSIAK